MAKPCPACGFANYEGMQRCARCGGLLAGAAPPGTLGGDVPGPKGRDPLAAALLSFLMAGGGQMYNEQVLKGEVIFFTWFLIVPWLYGILDAYRTASRMAPLAQLRSPGMATLLGHMVPGAGQAYNRQWGKAILVFVTSPFILPWVFGIFDANRTAKRINAGIISLAPPPTARTVVLAILIGLVVVACLLWLLASLGIGPGGRFPI
jgi:TM2 domain-containing membrane protein YozV